MKLWSSLALISSAHAFGPQCGLGEVSSIHYCLGTDIPKNKAEKCMIHCDTERYEAFGNDCRCKGQRKCLVVYCHKTDIIEILTMDPTKRPKTTRTQKAARKQKEAALDDNLRVTYSPGFEDLHKVSLKSISEDKDIKIMAGNETVPKKATKKRGMKMLQRLKKIDSEAEKPPVSLKSVKPKNKRRHTTTEFTTTTTTTKATKNNRDRPKREKKMAKKNSVPEDVLVQAEAKFVKHGKGLFNLESSFRSNPGQCAYLDANLAMGDCKFPLQSGERCRPTCADPRLIPSSPTSNMFIDCTCNSAGTCVTVHDIKCVPGCDEPSEEDLPIGMVPVCPFPLPGGERCNFECVYGSFTQVEKAYGRCNCRGGTCSFINPKASCGPDHSKYCKVPDATLYAHPKARVKCAQENVAVPVLSSFVSAKTDQFCWLECEDGFVWEGDNRQRRNIKRSPQLECDCTKQGCELKAPEGRCVLGALPDF